MGLYRCDICECYYCSHDVCCYESPYSKFELICEGCEIDLPIKEGEKEDVTYLPSVRNVFLGNLQDGKWHKGNQRICRRLKCT